MERVVSGCSIWCGVGSPRVVCYQRRGVRVVVCLQHWLGGVVHWVEGVDFMFLYVFEIGCEGGHLVMAGAV